MSNENAVRSEKKKTNLLGKAGGGLWRWAVKHWQYLAIFAVPFAVMYLVYAVFKVHPFGENSVLVLDLNGQYVYFYEALRDAFWGKGSLIYNWSRNISGEMFGIFAYYLASPFMLIICLLPRTCMLGAIELMQLAKIGASAVTFSFFLNKTSGKDKPKFPSLLVFSTMYALCAYMVVELMDPMWLDGLVYLPLIFWGVHRLIEDRVMLPYIIPLALMFIAHFYIGYMVGIFTFLYFIYCMFSKEGRIIPKGWLGCCGRFAFGTFAALMSSMWVLLPVYKSLSLGKMEFSVADFSLRTQFKLIDFTTKLFPLTYDTVRNEGLPMVYSGILAIIMLPLFFLNSKISLKEKVSKGLLLAVTFIFMYIAPIDIAMHGFQVPNWLPYRYSFVFSFFLLVMAFRAFQNLDGITGKELGAAMFGILAYIVYLDDRGYEHFSKLSVSTLVDGSTQYKIQGVWFAVIAVFVMYILLCLIKRYNNKIVYGVLCGAVCIELFANSYDTVLKIDEDVSYSTYTSYQQYMIDMRNTVEKVNEYDNTPFFRMESTYHRTVCDPIGTGYHGISHSSSTMNAPVLKGLQDLGYAYGGNYTSYRGTTPIMDAVLGIKYLMDWNTQHTGNTKVPEDYPLVLDSSQTGTDISVYQNPYSLGMGFAADNMMENYFLEDANPFVNQNNLLNYALGVDEMTYTEYMTRIFPESIDTENLATAGVSENHTKYYYKNTSIGECHEDFLFTIPEDTEHFYMYFPTMYERKVNVWLKRDDVFADADQGGFNFINYFFEGDYYSVLDLGSFHEGESVRVRVSIPMDPGEAYWSDTYFYYFHKDRFVNAVEQLGQNVWNITKQDDTHIEGNITVGNDQMLFTTMPYEEGWIIKVDGETVEPTVIADMFIGVKMSPGTHTVSMTFRPNYLIISIVLSVCGLLILVMVFLFEYKKGVLLDKIFSKLK